MKVLREGFGASFAWLASFVLLMPFFTTSQIALADDTFEIEPGAPTLTPITLSENDGDIFTSVQPAYTSSADRYNVETSVGLAGGHDDLEKLTMCWYLLDFADCSDDTKIQNEP